VIFIVAGAVVTVSVVGVVLGLKASKKQNSAVSVEKIIEDYSAIKDGYRLLKDKENRIIDDLEDIKPYCEGESINWKMYTISEDEEFLVVKGLSPADGKKAVDTIGGTSFIEKGYTFLSFLSAKKLSKVQPIAKIKVYPDKDIYTTTNMEYSAADSVVEDGEIKTERWEKNLPRFSKPGEYTIKLKVEDKNGNWSEWASKKITVEKRKGIRGVSAGPNSFITVMQNGDILICGENDYGEMGDGTNSKSEKITFNQRIDNIAQVAYGVDFTVARSFNGLVYCSGRNGFGQLGSGNRHNSKLYKKVWGMESVIQIGAGDEFACALSAGGEVYTWGNNEDGQLGKAGDTKYSELPELVQGLGAVKQLAVGAAHVLALLYDGTIMAWGGNRYGELGLGYTGKSTNIPTQTELKNIKSVHAGRGFSLAVTNDNRVMAWGQNNRNQLGLIGEKEILFPKEVPGLRNITKMEMGAKFVVALDNMGKVLTWGQYKPNDKSYFQKPTPVSNLPYVLDISANNKYAYAATSDNTVLRWSSDIKNHETFEIKANYEELNGNGEKS
jgi:alpha-tubulin suppressor-like RCC1 family protein